MSQPRGRLHLVAGALALVASLLISVVAPVTASPGVVESAHRRAQNVDYLSSETASLLALEFPVLVPPYVPGPFGGEPSVSAAGGYYSLYWMVGGGEPTFLQVTGEVGGALPAGSPYDLNIQLTINANVQGFDAIHDVTPVYDTVWWIAGGVLYKVESKNMQGDSLSLANSLIALIPPAAAEPPPPDPEPPTVEEPQDSGPVDGSTDGSEVDDVVTDETLAGEEASDLEPVVPAASDPADGEDAANTPDAGDDATDATDVSGTTDTSDLEGEAGDANDAPAGDGTGGPPDPMSGTDGTGGTNELVIPPDDSDTP